MATASTFNAAEFKLQSQEEVFKYLTSKLATKPDEEKQVSLDEETFHSLLVDKEKDSIESKEFLDWASQHRQLKVVRCEVPSGIVAGGYDVTLCDVRLFARGPDDRIYDSDKQMRERVARGNTVLALRERATGREEHMCVLQALKKFTGGLGDDDDRETGDNFTWQRYFTRPLEAAVELISLRKANGEAAHFSCRHVGGQFVMCGGSKNVHLLFARRSDILLYAGDRYRIASEVCGAIMDLLESLEPSQVEMLLSWLAVTGSTAVFEVLSPDHQHVEDLSYLSRAVLQFITFTTSGLAPGGKARGNGGLCAVRPDLGIGIARVLGVETVTYESLPVSAADDRMTQIRNGYNYEGEVLYFVDETNQVIGLLKKKTIWYVVCRAIREKVRNNCSKKVNKPQDFSPERVRKQIITRLRDIQRWLSIDDASRDEWVSLGQAFFEWCVEGLDIGTVKQSDIADLFPVTWKRFLADKGRTDVIAGKTER